MFLHPVNVRCLVREYGSLEQSPEKISATVVEIAGYSMSEVRLYGEQCVLLTWCLWGRSHQSEEGCRERPSMCSFGVVHLFVCL